MENEPEELVCSICNATVLKDTEVCESCGSDLVEFETSSPAANKYSKLKIISNSFRILGFVYGALTLIGVVLIISKWSSSYNLSGESTSEINISNLIAGVGTPLVIGAVIITILFALSEGINILIDMESNSRVRNRILQKLLNIKKQQS